MIKTINRKLAKDIKPGDVFNRLRVDRLGPATKARKRRWYCTCECGKIVLVVGADMAFGRSQSCGCRQRDMTLTRNLKHGQSGTPEYQAWWNMIHRCTSPDNEWFDDYGGRGIAVCESWLASFEAFFADMGNRPSDKHSLDRINVNGNYEPSNCRWATKSQQCRNIRNNFLLTHNGKTATPAEWSEITGIKDVTIKSRLRYGWSIEKALTAPVRAKAPNEEITPEVFK